MRTKAGLETMQTISESTDDTLEDETFVLEMNTGVFLQDGTGSLQKEERSFRGILSGEVIDKEGDRIPIDEFAKLFEIMLRRRTPINIKHTPITVGYLSRIEKTTYNRIPAVLVEGVIHKDFPKDHFAWNNILNGRYFGLSFTGDWGTTQMKETEDGRVYAERSLAGIYEITITDRPANQVSTILDTLVKEYYASKEVEDGDNNPESEAEAQDDVVEIKIEQVDENMTEENKACDEPTEEEKSVTKEEFAEGLKTLAEAIAAPIKELTVHIGELTKLLPSQEKEAPETDEPTEDPPKEEKEVDLTTIVQQAVKDQFTGLGIQLVSSRGEGSMPPSDHQAQKESPHPDNVTGELPSMSALQAYYLGED